MKLAPGLIAAVLILAGVTAWLEPGLLRTLLLAALAGGALFATAALCVTAQRGELGASTAFAPVRTLRWSGTLLAGIAGPLIVAKLMVGGLALLSGATLPTEGAGMLAGIGAAWLVLPMAMLVIGTAALKLPACALDRPLDTSDAIRLANGHEWSLLPLGAGLTLGLLALVAGYAAVATGRFEGLALLVVGMCLLPWVALRLARRWRALAA